MSETALEKTADELNSYLGRRTGRKRNATVTLPGYESAPRGWTYRKIDDSTVAQDKELNSYENIAQLTEIFEQSFASLASSQDRRVEMLKRNTPAKPKTKKGKQKFTIGDATPERFRHAKSAGKRLITEKETFDDGRETGIQRKRFIGFLETWHNRNVIDKATFTAAETFQRDCDLSLEASPRMISRYGHILPRGVPELLPQEIQIEFERRKRAAMQSVNRRLHLILGWIAEVSNSDVHPDAVAELYFPNLSKTNRMERFKALFEYCCMELSIHYGQAERHRWVKMSTSKAAQELCDLLSA